MFEKISLCLSHLSSLFSTFASPLLFQVTVASCPGFYNSPLLAFFYLIWPPLQIAAWVTALECKSDCVIPLFKILELSHWFQDKTDFLGPQGSAYSVPCLELWHPFARCSLSPLTLHLSGLLSVPNKHYVLSFYTAFWHSVSGKLLCSLIWFTHVNPLDPVWISVPSGTFLQIPLIYHFRFSCFKYLIQGSLSFETVFTVPGTVFSLGG